MLLGLPVIAGHRGYKAKYPENTILGFTKCYESGAPCFETDVYLTADDVVVISHDVNTKRTYVKPNGEEADYHIPSSSYEHDLKDLVNKITGDKFLTFKTLLNFIIDNDDIPGQSVILDIKTYNKPRIIQQLFKEITAVKDDYDYWFKRIQFSVWDLNFVKYLNQEEYFQEVYRNNTIKEPFRLFHISVDWRQSLTFLEYNDYLQTRYGSSRQLFKTTGVSIIYVSTWSRDFLETFMPLAKLHNIDLWSWTINNAYQYEYFTRVCKAGMIKEYGIISDDPGQMIKHRDANENVHATEKDALMLPRLDLQQRLFNRLFELLGSLVKRPARDFESVVNPEQPNVRKLSPIVSHLFFFLQKLGIF